MHDGSLSTLDEVIEHYQQTRQKPTKGQSTKIHAFTLSPQEKQDLLTFFDALTDDKLQDE